MRKKVLGMCLGVVLASSIAVGLTSRTYRDFRSYESDVTTHTFAAASGNYEILADSNDRTYVVDKLILAAGAAASEIYFSKNDTANIDYGPYTAVANTTVIDRDMLLKFDKSYGVYVSVDAACKVTLEYHTAEKF